MSSNDESEQIGSKRVEMPPLRTFEITRRFVNAPSERITVSAHILQHAGANADLLVFYDYIVDPVLGPQTRAHRMVRGDTDVQEVTPPASQIIQ
jgi:hypothetical protein